MPRNIGDPTSTALGLAASLPCVMLGSGFPQSAQTSNQTSVLAAARGLTPVHWRDDHDGLGAHPCKRALSRAFLIRSCNLANWMVARKDPNPQPSGCEPPNVRSSLSFYSDEDLGLSSMARQ